MHACIVEADINVLKTEQAHNELLWLLRGTYVLQEVQSGAGN